MLCKLLGKLLNFKTDSDRLKELKIKHDDLLRRYNKLVSKSNNLIDKNNLLINKYNELKETKINSITDL